MIVREASIEDLANIIELHSQSWRENYSNALSDKYLSEEVYSDRKKVWTARFKNPPVNQLVLIAEVEKLFCGFVCAFGARHSDYGTIIDNLHVKSNIKGKGVGTNLLISAAKWAATNYASHNLYLEVLAGNSKAIQFYESLGARKLDVAYWRSPCGNNVKELVYSWGLPNKLASKAARSYS